MLVLTSSAVFAGGQVVSSSDQSFYINGNLGYSYIDTSKSSWPSKYRHGFTWVLS